MANTDAAFGFRPVQGTGSSWNGELTKYYVPSTDTTAIYVGDLVKLAGSADSDGIATVERAGTSDVPCGVLMGVEPDKDDLTLMYRKASTAMYVYVCDDPGVVLEAQTDGTVTADDIGLNIDPTDSTGSTTTGISAEELDEDSADTTNTLMFHQIGLAQYPDNSIGADAIMRVRFNVHQYAQSTGTTGL